MKRLTIRIILLTICAMTGITATARAGYILAGSYDTPGIANSVYVSGNYAYVADGSSGLQIIDISDPANPTVKSTYDTPGHAWDVFVSGNYAYVADRDTGLLIIDISTPTSPTLKGTYDTPGYGEGVYVSGNYAYVADGISGLQIIDISNSENPTFTGSYDTSGEAWRLYVSGSYAYIADYDSGLQIIDISDPANPSLAGTYDMPGNAFDVYVSGSYAYVADLSAGLQIIDITDPTNPSLTSAYDTSGNAYDVYVSGNNAYVADGSSGFQIIDISNLATPSLKGTYNTPGLAVGIYILGNHVYMADDSSGLQVFGPTVPVQSNWQPATATVLVTTAPAVTFGTNENATCKWSLSNELYTSMTNVCAGAGTMAHSCDVTGITETASNSIYLACADADGFSGATSTNVILTYDAAVEPTITDNQDGDDTWYSSDPGTIFDVDFADAGGAQLDNVQYTVWSGPNMTGMQAIPWTDIETGINAGSYTTNWGVDFASLTLGMNYVSVRAFDNAGNVATSTDVFFVKKDNLSLGISFSIHDETGNAVPGATLEYGCTGGTSIACTDGIACDADGSVNGIINITAASALVSGSSCGDNADETLNVSVSKTGFITSMFSGIYSLAGVNSADTQLLYSLKVNVQDELGLQLDGATVMQSGGSFVTCIGKAGTAGYYCPVPTGETSAVEISRPGFVSKNLATAGTVNTSAQMVQTATPGSGSALQYSHKITSITNEIGGDITATATALKVGEAICTLYGGAWYCPVPVEMDNTSVIAHVLLDGYVLAPYGSISNRSTDADAQMTDAITGVLFSHKIAGLSAEGTYSDVSGSVTGVKIGSVDCINNDNIWYCPVPLGGDNITASAGIQSSIYINDTYGPVTDRISHADPQAFDNIAGIKYPVKSAVWDELGNEIHYGTMVQSGGSGVNCQAGSGSNIYYCPIPAGESVNLSFSETGYIDKALTSASISATSSQVILDATGTEAINYSVKVTLKDETSAMIASGEFSVTTEQSLACTWKSGTANYFCPVPDGGSTLITVTSPGWVTATTSSTPANTTSQTVVTFSEDNAVKHLYAITGSAGGVETETGQPVTLRSDDSVEVCLDDACTSTEAICDQKFAPASNTIYIAPCGTNGDHYITLASRGFLRGMAYGSFASPIGDTQLQPTWTVSNGNPLSYQIVIDSENVRDQIDNIVELTATTTVTLCNDAACSSIDTPLVSYFDEATHRWYFAPTYQLTDKYIRLERQGFVTTTTQTAVYPDPDGSQVMPVFDTANDSAFPYQIKLHSGAGYLEDELGNALYLSGSETVEICQDAACTATDTPLIVLPVSDFIEIAPSATGSRWIRIKKDGFVVATTSSPVTFDEHTFAYPAWTTTTSDALKYPLKMILADELGNEIATETPSVTVGSLSPDVVDGATLYWMRSSEDYTSSFFSIQGFVSPTTSNSGVASFLTSFASQTVIVFGRYPILSTVVPGTVNYAKGLEYHIKLTGGENKLEDTFGNPLEFTGDEMIETCTDPACTAAIQPLAAIFDETDTSWYISSQINDTVYLRLNKPGFVKQISKTGTTISTTIQTYAVWSVASSDSLAYQLKITGTNSHMMTDFGTQLNASASDSVVLCTDIECSSYVEPLATHFDLSGKSLYVAPPDTGTYYVQISKTGYVKTVSSPVAISDSAQSIPDWTGATGLQTRLKLLGGTGYIENEAGTSVTLTGSETLTLCEDSLCSTVITPPVAPVFAGTGWNITTPAEDSYYVRVFAPGYVSQVSSVYASDDLQSNPLFTVSNGNPLPFPLKLTLKSETGDPLKDIMGSSLNVMTGSVLMTYNSQTPAATTMDSAYWAVFATGAPLIINAPGYIVPNTYHTALDSVTTNSAAQTVINLDGTDTTLSGGITAGEEYFAEGLRYAVRVELADKYGNAIEAGDMDTLTLDGYPPVASAPTDGSIVYWPHPDTEASLSAIESGYVSAASTNSGLNAFTPATSSQTGIVFGNNSSSGVINGGIENNVQGLVPTVQIITTDVLGNTIYGASVDISSIITATDGDTGDADGSTNGIIEIAVDPGSLPAAPVFTVSAEGYINYATTTAPIADNAVTAINAVIMPNTTIYLSNENGAPVSDLLDSANFTFHTSDGAFSRSTFAFGETASGTYRIALPADAEKTIIENINIDSDEWDDYDVAEFPCSPALPSATSPTECIITVYRPADYITISPATATITAGDSQSFTFTVYDNNGAVIDKGNDSYIVVSIILSGGSENPASMSDIVSTNCQNAPDVSGTQDNAVLCQFSSGSATIEVRDIFVTDETTPVSISLLPTSGNEPTHLYAISGTGELLVEPSILNHFVFSLPAVITPGMPVELDGYIKAADTYGNVIPSFDASADPVTITAAGGLTGAVSGLGSGNDNILNQASDFQTGIADLVTHGMIFTGATGTGYFTATSLSGSTGNSNSVQVSTAIPVSLALSAQDFVEAGAYDMVIVTLIDDNGQITFATTATEIFLTTDMPADKTFFTLNTSEPIPVESVTIAAGAASAPVYFSSRITGATTITASSPSLGDDTTFVTVNPAPAVTSGTISGAIINDSSQPTGFSKTLITAGYYTTLVLVSLPDTTASPIPLDTDAYVKAFITDTYGNTRFGDSVILDCDSAEIFIDPPTYTIDVTNEASFSVYSSSPGLSTICSVQVAVDGNPVTIANSFTLKFETPVSDITPPAQVPQVYDMTFDDPDTIASADSITAVWDESQDSESGIATYWVSLGAAPGASDTVPWTAATQTTAVFDGISLTEGTRYYFTVVAQNGAGLISAPSTSNGFVLDSLSPVVSLQSPAITNGNISITGIVSDSTLISWQLYYGPGTTPSNWKEFASGETPQITSGTLDTTILSGTYTIKLIATDSLDRISVATTTFTIDNTYTITGVIPALKWVFAGIPATPVSASVADIFSGKTYKVYRRDPRVTPDPYLGNYIIPTSFAAGEGYWIKVYGDSDFEYSFETRVTDTTTDFAVPVYPGWNQIAIPFLRDDFPAGALKVRTSTATYESLDDAASAGAVAASLLKYEYNGNIGSWKQVDLATEVLDPAAGYAIRAYTNAEIIFSPGAGRSDGLLRTIRQVSDYRFPISASTANAADSDNFIGVTEIASSAFGIEDLEEPPATPADKFISLYFHHDDWGTRSGRYTNDIRTLSRQSGSVETWAFKVASNDTGNNASITWDPAAIPSASYTFTLTDISTGAAIDMSTANSYSYPVSTTAREFAITVTRTAGSTPITYTASLASGWNLLGFPVEPSPSSAAAQVADDIPGANLFQFYNNTFYPLETADIQSGTACWIYSQTSASFSITGYPNDTAKPVDVPLTAGWNFIANPFAAAITTSSISIIYNGTQLSFDTAAANGIISPAILTYSDGAYSPATSQTLLPWKGYMIKALKPATIRFLIPGQ